MSTLLHGKLVLITGAGKGLGEAIAIGMALAGARVIVADRDAVAASDCVRRLREAGHEAWPEVIDVTDSGAVIALAVHVLQHYGAINVLVNNAGIAARSSIDEPDAKQVWDRVLSVNLQAVFEVTQAFLPALKLTQGCIINLSSIVAYSAGVSSPAYVTAKGAIRSLTQVLARDLMAYGIRVNALAPGLFSTDMTAGQRNTVGGTDWYVSRVPAKRLGEPDEVAGPAVFLASDMATYVNGVVLPVDGGYLAV